LTGNSSRYNIVLTMQLQKVFRAGNSNVVAIPKDFSEELGLKVGQEVTVEKIPGKGIFIGKPPKKERKLGVKVEFKKWLEEVLEEDKEILDELALR